MLPFTETRAFTRSYVPGTGTARPCSVTSVASGPWSPGCTSSRTRIEPMLQRSEEHTSELQSRLHLVCRLLLEKKKNIKHETKLTASTSMMACDGLRVSSVACI